MSKISEYLDKIKTAIYGREVRDAIHDSIKECYTDVTNSSTLADAASKNANTAAKNANDKASIAEASSNEANAAASNANTAASNANNKAAIAETSSNEANAAASNANDKAAVAESAAGLIQRMSVSSKKLPSGSSPTSLLEIVSGDSGKHYNLVLGIPIGDTGSTPNITFTVSTGEAGTNASVDVSGTPENPVVHLTIPRGAAGNIDNITINDKKIENGSLTLTASDIGALPSNTYIPQKTSDLTNDSGFVTSYEIPKISAEATTGEPGTQVSVTQSGTTANPVFSFVIPRGDKGATGEKGDPGPAGPQGEKGDPGPAGVTFELVGTVLTITTT